MYFRFVGVGAYGILREQGDVNEFGTKSSSCTSDLHTILYEGLICKSPSIKLDLRLNHRQVGNESLWHQKIRRNSCG